MSLRSRIPDAEVLISLAPEELASQLLISFQLPPHQNQGMLNRNDAISRLASEYPQRQGDVELAVCNVLRYLSDDGLAFPALVRDH